MDIENKYGTLAIQKELLVLLKEFHSFCKRNNIQYSLAYGSLLGAVRHKGLIPWHDDLDIMVDRDNYSVLRSALISESDCGLILSSYYIFGIIDFSGLYALRIKYNKLSNNSGYYIIYHGIAI